MALIDKIKAIADAIRAKTGSTGLMSLDEMAESIEYMSTDDTQTYILVDEDGYEIPAVLVDEPVELTATTNDIRIGTTAVTEAGVVTGEKEIPSYYTTEGYRAVTKGSLLAIPHEHYDYEKLQAVMCNFNTSFANSVAANRVALEGNVYDVNSTTSLSTITKDSTNARIDFGLTNDSDGVCVIRYFMYKEIY